VSALLFAGCGSVNIGSDWRTASREGTGQAPDPMETTEAVVQVYAARAFNWRGIFAVHTWIATKRTNGLHYTVHQTLGWNRYYGRSVVVSAVDIPDRRWYDAWPEIVADLRGPAAEAVIPAIVEAAGTDCGRGPTATRSRPISRARYLNSGSNCQRRRSARTT
jgi:hypothetical protein